MTKTAAQLDAEIASTLRAKITGKKRWVVNPSALKDRVHYVRVRHEYPDPTARSYATRARALVDAREQGRRLKRLVYVVTRTGKLKPI